VESCVLFEKTRRLAHGYRNFENYRLRMLLAREAQELAASNEDDVTTITSEKPLCRPCVFHQAAAIPTPTLTRS
jgi:hypothetical protein